MRRALPILGGCTLLLAGCGSAAHPASVSTTSTTTPTPNPTAQLQQAIRTALQDNARVSDYVLEHNAIPSWAGKSTAGPALAGMRGSAAQRRSGHLTVRVISNEVQVRAIDLDPSYTTATAIVTDRSRVLPYRNGRALGKDVKSSEKTRFELHRVGNTMSFVVWRVAPA